MSDERVQETRAPAEVLPIGVYIQDELDARGWDADDLALQMGGAFGTTRIIVGLMLMEDPPVDMLLDANSAERLAKALGTSPKLWLNLHAAWRSHTAALSPREGEGGREEWVIQYEEVNGEWVDDGMALVQDSEADGLRELRSMEQGYEDTRFRLVHRRLTDRVVSSAAALSAEGQR